MPLTLLCIACAMPGDISLSSLLLQNVQVLLNLCTTKEKYAVKQYFLPQKEQHTLYNQLLYNMAIKSFNEFLSKPLTTTMKTQRFAFLFACNSRALATSSPNFPTLQVSGTCQCALQLYTQLFFLQKTEHHSKVGADLILISK